MEEDKTTIMNMQDKKNIAVRSSQAFRELGLWNIIVIVIVA